MMANSAAPALQALLRTVEIGSGVAAGELDTSKNRVILASSVRTVHAGLTKYGF